jgi:hypothetical protein
LSVGRFNGGPIDGVARQRSDTQQSQDKDFSLKLPSRLEASHSMRTKSKAIAMTLQACSDSLLTMGQMD